MNCLSCKSNISNNLNSKKWAIVKILDLKQRGFEVTGFPHTGFVTVRGWKIKKVNQFTTDICTNCVNQYIKKQKASQSFKVEIYKKIQKWLNILGPVIGIVSLLLMYFISQPKADEPLSDTNIFILLYSSILLILPLLFPIFKPQENSNQQNFEELNIDRLHRRYIEPYLTQMSKSLNINIFSLILHPEPMMPGPTIDVGLHFIVPEKALQEYTTNEQETGWSRIDYYARFGTYSPGPYDKYLQRDNKEHFGFKHWGEFLSKPIKELKTIIGVTDIKN